MILIWKENCVWQPPHLNFFIYSSLSGSLEVMKYCIYKLEYLLILTSRFLTLSLHCQWGEDWRVNMVCCLKEEKQKLFLQSKITRRNLLQIITKRKADTKRRFFIIVCFLFQWLAELYFIIICWRREKKTFSNQCVCILSSYQDSPIFFSYLKDKDISIFPLLRYTVREPGHIWGCEIQLHSYSLFREKWGLCKHTSFWSQLVLLSICLWLIFKVVGMLVFKEGAVSKTVTSFSQYFQVAYQNASGFQL